MPTAVIVDDSPIARIQMRQVLVKLGCTVSAEGASGEDVRALYERHRPDLITLDIVMPGKDGVTAAAELLKEYPTAKVVMCTSLAAREKIMACKQAGVTHYLLKPFDPAHAEKVLRVALEHDATKARKR
jgi:two-component system, chemotaxis family, chemotaxis protein CheY